MSPKPEFEAENQQYGRVIYPSIGNFTWSMKKYTLGGQNGKNMPPEPKNGIWGPKSIWPCDKYFTLSKKKYTLRGVKKEKISLQSPKTEFGAQNQYDQVTYPSIGNFTWNKK
jgi:hypothetical protein